VELITLTVWGYLTPGQIIPNYQAILVLGGLAAITAAAVWAVYHLTRKTNKTAHSNLKPSTNPPVKSLSAANTPAQTKKQLAKHAGESIFNQFTAVFIVFLAVASVSLASAVNMLFNIVANAPLFALALTAFLISSIFLCQMLRKFVLAYEGAVTKR
jgi:hypothetical protein